MKHLKESLVLTVALATLVGCSSTASTETNDQTMAVEEDSAQSYHVVVSNYAVYDWTAVLLEGTDTVTVSYLLDSGVDSHSYQPTTQDIVEIAECDLFIHIGGESDTWVDGVLAQATNEDMIVLNLMDVLGDGVRAEETVEGMEVSDHDHEEEAEADHDHEEEAEADEHIWLSLRNAQVLTTAIAEQLMAVDGANADTYATNLDGYVTALADLDDQYATAVEAATSNTVLVADRFPFLYLVSDYGLDYYAAFSGCSAETEASFETIVFLAGKVDELGLDTILTIENPQHEIAQTVATTATQTPEILVLNSMQSITADDITANTHYYDIMVENLAVLIEALG